MEHWQVENCVLYVCTTALVLGLYAMGAGGLSFWGLLLLLFVNYRRRDATVSEKEPPAA